MRSVHPDGSTGGAGVSGGAGASGVTVSVMV
jgi:hypothetical protein